MKILILASNPRKDLNLDREIRDLKRAIENSRNREEFEVVDELAVRVGDLQELLHKHRPQIVHFCGHGGGEQGLVFESDVGREHLVSTDALSNLFRLFSSSIECVLLNACYSEEQAGAIVDHINYVIGMNQEIRDDAAIAFSKGFYRALGYACSIEQSYEFGCNAIQLEISGSSVVRSTVSETERKLGVADAVAKIAIPEHQKPILKKKPTLTSNLSASIPSPNQTLSQEKRTEIQLDIDTSLKADSKVKQYRDRVREFLGDRKLTEFEKIRLDQLQKSLGLSDEEARQILTEEQAPLQKARDEYKEMVIQLIEKGQYPFNVQTEQELGQLRQELQLTDEEVNEISRPIIEKAEAEYQAMLAQQKYNLGVILQNQGKTELHEGKVTAPSEARREYKVDFTKLKNLLKTRQWQEANQETAWLILNISGKQGQKWLFKEDVENFPRLDFQTIDSLWTKYSKGKFGFSVQKEIWYECGKPRFYSDDWEKLGERLGWRKGNFFKKEWIYGAASFDISAPLGHLPLALMDLEYPPTEWGAGDLVRTLFLRHDL